MTDDIHLFNDKLREWENYYNYHRPQGALDGQTPYERLVAKARAGVSPELASSWLYAGCSEIVTSQDDLAQASGDFDIRLERLAVGDYFGRRRPG